MVNLKGWFRRLHDGIDVAPEKPLLQSRCSVLSAMPTDCFLERALRNEWLGIFSIQRKPVVTPVSCGQRRLTAPGRRPPQIRGGRGLPGRVGALLFELFVLSSTQGLAGRLAAACWLSVYCRFLVSEVRSGAGPVLEAGLVLSERPRSLCVHLIPCICLELPVEVRRRGSAHLPLCASLFVFFKDSCPI